MSENTAPQPVPPDSTPPTPTDLIRVSAAAKILGIHPVTLREWIHAGKIPGFRIGCRWRLSRADVDAAVKQYRPVEVDRPRTRAEIAAVEKWVEEMLRPRLRRKRR